MEKFSFSLGDISAKKVGEISFSYVITMEVPDCGKDDVSCFMVFWVIPLEGLNPLSSECWNLRSSRRSECTSQHSSLFASLTLVLRNGSCFAKSLHL